MVKLFRYLKPYSLQVLLVMVLVVVQSFTELMLPTLLADIVDIGVVNSDNNFILQTGVYMILIALVGSISTIWKAYLSARVSSAFGRTIREEVFTKIESFNAKEFDKISGSSLITRTTNDVTQVQRVVVQIMNMFLRAPMLAIGGVIMALSRDGELSIILAVAVVVMVILVAFVASKAVPLFKSLQLKVDRLNLLLRERLTGIRVIRAFDRTKLEKERFSETNQDVMNTSLRINRLMVSMMPLMTLLFNTTSAVIIYFGAFRVDAGGLLTGDLIAYIQYVNMIMFSLIMFTMMFVLIPRAQVSAKRINEVLELDVDVKAPLKPRVEHIENSIEYKNVAFSYNGAERNAIEGISFKVSAGETLAIIGGTGSGKSSIINLLPKLYNRTEGEILVGGVEIDAYGLENLRDEVSFVPQKTMLFGGTIRENIQAGSEISDEAIHEALRVAQASEFVDELEEGLDYQVSQGGMNLSGGQKQRLSIARALAKDSLVYVFDDSFSALDFKTDSKLRKELKTRLKDKIQIVVAQRITSIRDSKRILVLDKGTIVGDGTHQELIQHCKVYQDIAYSQLSEEEL